LGRAGSDRRFLVLAFLVVCALATIGGLVLYAFRGGTTVTRAIATGYWVAAAVVLFLSPVWNHRLLRRRGLRPIDGWAFVGASVGLTCIGAVIDVAGTSV